MEAKNNDLIKSLIKTAQGGTATLSRKSVMWLHKEEGEDAGQAKARWLLCGHELTWKQAVGLCFLQQHSASLGRAQRKWVIGTELSKHCGIGAITVIRPYTTVGGAGEEMSKFGAEGWEESQEPALALATCGHWQAFCKPATSSSRSQITRGPREASTHNRWFSLAAALALTPMCPGCPGVTVGRQGQRLGRRDPERTSGTLVSASDPQLPSGCDSCSFALPPSSYTALLWVSSNPELFKGTLGNMVSSVNYAKTHIKQHEYYKIVLMDNITT